VRGVCGLSASPRSGRAKMKSRGAFFFLGRDLPNFGGEQIPSFVVVSRRWSKSPPCRPLGTKGFSCSSCCPFISSRINPTFPEQCQSKLPFLLPPPFLDTPRLFLKGKILPFFAKPGGFYRFFPFFFFSKKTFGGEQPNCRKFSSKKNILRDVFGSCCMSFFWENMTFFCASLGFWARFSLFLKTDLYGWSFFPPQPGASLLHFDFFFPLTVWEFGCSPFLIITGPFIPFFFLPSCLPEKISFFPSFST